MLLYIWILFFHFIPAIIVTAVGSTNNNSWNTIQNQNQSDIPDTKNHLDLDNGRDLTDLSHENIPSNATGTGSDSTQEGVDDYEVEAGENKNGTEIYVFWCNNRTNASTTIATKTATTRTSTDAENDKDADRIRVPAWLRAPMENYKKDAISFTFALPLFTFRPHEGHLLSKCGHPNGFKRYKALLNETHRKFHYVHSATGYLIEFDWTEERSAHWSNYFTHKGYFKEKDIYYHPQHYCIHTMTDTELELDLCPPQEGVDLIVNKCCPLGSVVRTNPYEQPFYGTGCVEEVEEWEPVVPKNDQENEEIYPYYRHVIIQCDNAIDGLISNEKLPIHGISLADIQLQRTGKVFSRATGNHRWDRPKYDSLRYIESVCIDSVIVDTSFYPEHAEYTYAKEKELTVVPEYVFLHENQILLFCPNETTINESRQQQIFSVTYFILYCISTPFHLVTFLVYLLVARRQNVHGWTIAGFSSASLINNLSITVSHAAISFQYSEVILFRSTSCITVAIINHFGYIAQFSWMTVLNFDLWLTISSMAPMMGRSRGFKRFMGYCAFGFGVPTVVVVTSVILEVNYGLFDDRVTRPQYGHVSCNVDDSAYFHMKLLPTFILYAFNVLFISLTCHSLYQFKKDTVRVKSNLKSPQIQTRIFGKLFILMGVCWMSDIISGFFVGQELRWYSAIFDIWIILQSIFLFWIFVCKKEIKDHLCMSYKPFKYVWELLERKLFKQKPAPSLFFFGSFLQSGATQNTSVSKMQSIRLARLRSLR